MHTGRGWKSSLLIQMPRKRLLASMAVHFDLMLTFAVSAILSTGEENNELIEK